LSTPESSNAPPQAAGAPQSQPAGDVKSLVAQAGRDFDDYQRLTSQGKLADAGQKLDDLKRTIDKLNALQK